MSRFISVAAVLIFVIAVGVNFIFFGDEPGGADSGESSGAAGASKDGSGNPAGDKFISPEDIEVPDQPGGGVPVGEVDIRVKEGRTNGQRDFAREFVKTVYGLLLGQRLRIHTAGQLRAFGWLERDRVPDGKWR
jgi:hypothetical protein